MSQVNFNECVVTQSKLADMWIWCVNSSVFLVASVFWSTIYKKKNKNHVFVGGGENQSDRGGGCGLQGGWALSGGGVQRDHPGNCSEAQRRRTADVQRWKRGQSLLQLLLPQRRSRVRLIHPEQIFWLNVIICCWGWAKSSITLISYHGVAIHDTIVLFGVRFFKFKLCPANRIVTIFRNKCFSLIFISVYVSGSMSQSCSTTWPRRRSRIWMQRVN